MMVLLKNKILLLGFGAIIIVLAGVTVWNSAYLEIAFMGESERSKKLDEIKKRLKLSSITMPQIKEGVWIGRYQPPGISSSF